MISKKEKILGAALELFAKEGFSSVSTSRIAKRAGVSEGLIFRHFKSKKALLSTIMERAKEKTIDLFAPIIMQADPARAIKMVIGMPFEIPEREYPFWKLIFKLKWESHYSEENKMTPLVNKLIWAFSQLGYRTPKKEAEVLNHTMESILTAVLRDGAQNQKPLKQFLIQKYDL